MGKFVGQARLPYLWENFKSFIASKKYAGGTSDGGTANKAAAIPFGKVDSTSTSTAFTATVEGITELKDGTCVYLMNSVVTSAANFTININGLGAKPSYSNMATGNPITPTAPTRDTTIFNINYTMLFVYNSTLVDGGAWVCYRGYDANTNTLGYQLRTNSYVLNASDGFRYYVLLFTSADGTKWVPANSNKSNSATTTKTVNQTPINPFGEIVYCGNSTNYSAGGAVTATAIWQQYTVTLGYSFNTTGAALTLTTKKPVYVKCAPQANGSAIIDSTTPYVQELPTTNDGKIYILLGMAYSATSIELLMVHPVYYYKDGAIRLWSNATEPDLSGYQETIDDLDEIRAGAALGATALQSYTESDPTVPAWAKQNTKPSYTPQEIGALPDSYTPPVLSVNGQTGDVSLTIPPTITESTISGWGFTKNAGTYSKPSNGIPKTDLADAVQASLGKADTALQSFTESDPTVPAWAKATNKPSYTAQEVGALPDSTTIPTASTDTPQMDGTGAAGSASTYAKGDHVHPTDTSREARVTTVSHGTNDTTFALTPNVLHTWGTVNSLTLSLASGSSTYVDGYWFKFTAGSSFTALTLPTGVDWVVEPEIEAGKTYEVMIVDGLASYVTDGIGDSVKAKTRIVNHGTSDTTFTLTPNTFHIWGEVASLNLSLQTEASGFVNGYWFRFTCGSTPTVLTLPSSVEWYYENVEFEANHTYEVTIVEGKACYTDYASATQIATKQWVQNNTKTINGESIIGEGDIVIEGGESTSEIPVVNHGTSDTSISILPNIFHVWGEVSSLTLTLAAGGSGVVNEYMFQFTSGSTPTSLSFSSNVSWITDSTIEANKTYQVSILNNLVVMGGA